MIATVTATIRGISPLLMHAYPLVPVEALEKKSAEEQAEYGAYRLPGGKTLCIPSMALQRAIVNGATYSKGKGRASLQKQVAACVLVSPAYLSLDKTAYEVDVRPVVIPA